MGAGGLDTTNAMLRSLIDGIADPVYDKDAEGRYLLVNPAAASAAGLRPDQVLGYTDAELLPGPVAARLRAADRRVMASELPSRSREELAGSEGPRVYQALKAPWRDADGRIAGVVGVSRDVTEEERADRDRRRLLARLHDIQEEERGRIAVGLHDGPLQGLATLGYKLARARALLADGHDGAAALAVLAECETDVVGEVAALRRTMHDLRPLVLDQQGLAAALEDQAVAVRARAGLAACRVSVNLAGGRLPPTVEIALFRVAQQALANVADHAGASEVELWLEQAPTGHVRLAVSDDGCGFDPARVSGGGYGFGLTVMAERVEALGGRLAVRAREEGGTMDEACIPGPPGRPA
ncbi:MAG TPA: PAS domain-containing protein [Actinomycetota bacterium]|nr:PAS domain-containing protein [Actinomycetota bacterium]